MAASLPSDGRIWKACRYCFKAIWRYPNGQLWRDADMRDACPSSMARIHVPEY